jgi:hypothetical protein
VHALLRCHAEGVTGIVRVTGNPGGVFHLRKGVVIAVESPGAPGAEALLLRSGRISEEDWTAALREGDFTARGSAGSVELQVVAMTAAQDGAFAVTAGDLDGLVVDEPAADVPLPVADGIDPHELLRETARRLDALAALPCPLSPYRERLVPVPGAGPAALSVLRQEILAHANGRRSARDIAFAIGRSVYPVTVEVSRMLGAELLAIAQDVPAVTTQTRLESLRPRHAAAESQETERKDVGL